MIKCELLWKVNSEMFPHFCVSCTECIVNVKKLFGQQSASETSVKTQRVYISSCVFFFCCCCVSFSWLFKFVIVMQNQPYTITKKNEHGYVPFKNVSTTGGCCLLILGLDSFVSLCSIFPILWVLKSLESNTLWFMTNQILWGYRITSWHFQ